MQDERGRWRHRQVFGRERGVQAQSTIGFDNADLAIDDIPFVGFVVSV